jgi:hypothetical protein
LEKRIWSKVSKLKPLISEETFSLLAKYKARADFALGLRNTPNEKLSIETTEAYFVFLKLSLVYSALELLDQATGKARAIHVTNAPVSHELASGKFKKLLSQIEASTPLKSRDKAQKILGHLTYKSENVSMNNLYDFMGLCRHLMFHGAFTPAGSGLVSSKYHRELLLGLAIEAIRAGDAYLENWVARKIRKTAQLK